MNVILNCIAKMIMSTVFCFVFSTEMRNMQSAAREHSRRIFQETDQLRKQLDEKESGIQRRSMQLNELVAQTDMERRKLENERKKVPPYPKLALCYCLAFTCLYQNLIFVNRNGSLARDDMFPGDLSVFIYVLIVLLLLAFYLQSGYGDLFLEDSSWPLVLLLN